jgi:hypothetical protein
VSTAFWFPAAAPSVLLALAVLYSRFSGNDKAPFLVLLVLAIDAVLVLVLAVLAAHGQSLRGWRRAGVAVLPLLYAGVVVVLARRGWIDMAWFLGFR